ncbi:MAG: hypothetical protein M5R40_21900 [Anaerolineae bacterium]|nr:hypothetical protein [Anaerolineae bacterium]
MLLPILDPALLIYRFEHWQSRQEHCFRRFKSATCPPPSDSGKRLEYSNDQHICGIDAGILSWNEDLRSVRELRDLRTIIYELLQKAYYVEEANAEVELYPAGVVCKYIETDEIIIAWHGILCGCVAEPVSLENDPLVGTWEFVSSIKDSSTLKLSIRDAEAAAFRLPIVWDEASWVAQLATQEYWPDLQRCVESYFIANPNMKMHPGARTEPIPFDASRVFLDAVHHYCDNDRHLRDCLIKAIAKRVYGLLDAGLRDEPFRGMRRFRVTGGWRVNYREEKGRLILEEFGSHDIGM